MLIAKSVFILGMQWLVDTSQMASNNSVRNYEEQMDVVVQRFVRFLGCSLKTMKWWKIQDPDIRPELKDICTTFAIQVMKFRLDLWNDKQHIEKEVGQKVGLMQIAGAAKLMQFLKDSVL